jgi:hypothetical protein
LFQTTATTTATNKSGHFGLLDAAELCGIEFPCSIRVVTPFYISSTPSDAKSM